MQERSEIEPSAARDYRQAPAPGDFAQNGPGQTNIFSRAANLFGIQCIEKVMGYAPPFALRQFRRADIEHAVQLQGIAVHNLPAKPFGDGERQVALARSGRSEHNCERVQSVHKFMILGQNHDLATILSLGPLPRCQAEFTQKASPVE